jgi:xanthine dehydrogenase accessory factor
MVRLDRTLTSVEASEQSAVEIFIEIIGSDPDLYIFGAGQVAVPTAKLAAETGFRVHVIDTRPLFAKRERFPTVSEVVVGFPGEIAREREFPASSFGLVLTHSAAHDLPVLEGLLRSDIGYIGVLGSARRAAALASSLRDRGFREQDIARLHIPVGLDIGAESAEQLAVAVVAELLMVRNARSGQSMTLVQGHRLPS